MPGWVVWSSDVGVFGAQTPPDTFVPLQPAEIAPHGLATDGVAYVYWFTNVGDLVSLHVPTNARTVVTPAEAQGVDIAVSGNILFWTNGNGTIRRVGRGGGTPMDVVTGPSGADQLAVESSVMFWTFKGPTNGVATASTNGGPVATPWTAPAAGSATEILISGTQVYWLAPVATSGTVQTMSTTGGTAASITGGQLYGALGGLGADPTGVYFTAAGVTGLFRSPPGFPTIPPVLVTSITPPPARLAIQDPYIYFIDENGSKIKRVAK